MSAGKCQGFAGPCENRGSWFVKWAYTGATNYPSRYRVCAVCLEKIEAMLFRGDLPPQSVVAWAAVYDPEGKFSIDSVSR